MFLVAKITINEMNKPTVAVESRKSNILFVLRMGSAYIGCSAAILHLRQT
jgi:hypothetical protein